MLPVYLSYLAGADFPSDVIHATPAAAHVAIASAVVPLVPFYMATRVITRMPCTLMCTGSLLRTDRGPATTGRDASGERG